MMPFVSHGLQVGAPKEGGPCVCGCHSMEPNKPIRIKERWLCQACLDALAWDYAALVEGAMA
jgi:hypothetical protein